MLRTLLDRRRQLIGGGEHRNCHFKVALAEYALLLDVGVRSMMSLFRICRLPTTPIPESSHCAMKDQESDWSPFSSTSGIEECILR